jgi:hypothetical protein
VTQQQHEYGRCAYDTYRFSVGGHSVHGDKLWTWDEMRERNPKVAAAWQDAAEAVARLVTGDDTR